MVMCFHVILLAAIVAQAQEPAFDEYQVKAVSLQLCQVRGVAGGNLREPE